MAYPLHRRHRIFAAAAPLAAAAVVAAVVGAFHHASQAPWLAAGGAAAAMVAACERARPQARADRAREACVREVVARLQQAEQPAVAALAR